MVAAMGNAVPGLAGGVISGANAPATRPPAPRGAVHSAEIEYAMGNLATQQGVRLDARRLQGVRDDAGVFRELREDRRSERPGLPKWPAATGGGDSQVMRIDVTAGAAPEKHRARYLLLDSIYATPSK